VQRSDTIADTISDTISETIAELRGDAIEDTAN